MASELYIKRDDAIRAVLHNEGQAAVAAVENIKQINPHGEMREMLIDEMIDRANRPMNNAELITTLRWCGSEDERHEMCVDKSYRCPMWNEDRMTDYCKADLMLAAADALEAAEKRIAVLEKYCRECEEIACHYM